MKRAITAACLALCLLLPGCTLLQNVAATVLATSAVPGDSSAPATQTPSAALTASPSPVPAATATPAASASPTATPAPASDKFYVVKRGTLSGVVDETGREVLPCEFAQIEPIVLPEQTKPILFFAVPEVVTTKKDPAEPAGYLYRTDGTRLSDHVYRNVYAQQGCLQAFSIDAKMSFLRLDGSVVVPADYDDAYVLDHGFVGVKGEPEKVKKQVDVLDESGKVLQSAEINFRYAQGSYITVTDDTGNMVGVVDTSLKVVLQPEWEDVRPAGGSTFIVRKGGLYGVIDISGKEILPIKYTDFSDTGDEQYPFTASDSGGACLLDPAFHVVFKQAAMKYLQITDGVILGWDASNQTHALDAQGKDIIPPAVNVMWRADEKLFERYNSSGIVELYTKEGKLLPLPKANMLQVIGPDRYCVGVDQGGGILKYGIYDGSGNAVVKLTYSDMYPLGVGSLSMAAVDLPGGARRYGVVDADGKFVLPALYDSIYNDGTGSLLYAQMGPVHGLIDIHGNWIWHASDYDGLMD